MNAIKTIGKNGQISLGKQYAGRHAMVEEQEPGVWIIKLGDFVPDNERWLWEPKAAKKLSTAIKWAEQNSRRQTNLTDLEKQIHQIP